MPIWKLLAVSPAIAFLIVVVWAFVVIWALGKRRNVKSAFNVYKGSVSFEATDRDKFDDTEDGG